MNNFISEVLLNPIKEYLLDSVNFRVIEFSSWEKEYTVFKRNNSYDILIRKNGNKNLFKYIDQNKLLALYDKYDCVYGPYLESTKNDAQYILLLFRKFERNVELKTILFTRAIIEIKNQAIIKDNLENKKLPSIETIISDFPVVNEKCLRFVSVVQNLTEDQKKQILSIHTEYTKVGDVMYDSTWDRYLVRLSKKDKFKNYRLIHLLYEIYHNVKLDESQRVYQKNNRSRDIYINNLEIFDPKKEAWDKWKLDVDKLINILNNRNEYNYRFICVSEKMNFDKESLRRRTVLLKDITSGKVFETGLARAKLMIKLNRLLNKDETVDHIDRNYLNDNTDNLRSVSLTENVKDDSINIEIYPVICPVCTSVFTPSIKQRNESKRLNRAVYCSKKCSGKSRNLIKQKLIKPIKFSDIQFKYSRTDKYDINGTAKEYYNYKTITEVKKTNKSLIKIVPITN